MTNGRVLRIRKIAAAVSMKPVGGGEPAMPEGLGEMPVEVFQVEELEPEPFVLVEVVHEQVVEPEPEPEVFVVLEPVVLTRKERFKAWWKSTGDGLKREWKNIIEKVVEND